MLRRHRKRHQSAARLRGERLEPRLLMATFTVTNLNDSGPGSLRDALAGANSNFRVPDTIQFDSSLAGGTIAINSALHIGDATTIQGLGADQLTIDAQGNSGVFIVHDSDYLSDVHIDGLTITGGYADDGGGIHNRENLTIANSRLEGNTAVERGGGIMHRYDTQLTIADSVITGNSATSFEAKGGGLYVRYGTASVTNSVFSANEVHHNGWGGAITVGGTNYGHGELSLSDSLVTNNKSLGSGAEGGGIAVVNGAEASITDSQVTDNFSGSGGGLHAREDSELAISDSVVSNNVAIHNGGGVWLNDSTVTIDRSRVFDNLAQHSGGGGIDALRATLVINGSSILNNSANRNGGGISARDAFTWINDSTIAGNSAFEKGGGVFANNGTQISIHNSTVSGNRAFTGIGGGVANDGSLAWIYSSTITANRTADGFGSGLALKDNSQTRIHASIISGNVNSDVDRVDGGDPVNSRGFNLIGTGSAAAEFNFFDFTGITDPGLSPLGVHGGPTMTHAPLSGSMAIDNGANLRAFEFDQRGAPYQRDFGAAPDIGAVEFQPVVIDGDFDDDGNYSCADIDALVAEIVAGTHNTSYDLTGDAIVNDSDLDAWLAEAGAAELPSAAAYRRGDANLDGNVDAQDFTIWNMNKFTSAAAWCSADFNADGSVDGQDLLLWNANKFSSNDVSGAAAPRHDKPNMTRRQALMDKNSFDIPTSGPEATPTVGTPVSALPRPMWARADWLESTSRNEQAERDDVLVTSNLHPTWSAVARDSEPVK